MSASLQSDVPACLFPFDNMDPALPAVQWLSIKWEEWTQSSWEDKLTYFYVAEDSLKLVL